MTSIQDFAPMRRAVDGVWGLPLQFHDVDLTAPWPAYAGICEVAAQHPNGGPQGLTKRKDGTDIDSAMGELLQILAFQAGRRVTVSIFQGHDEQVVVLQERIGLARRVRLGFLVAPTSATHLVDPVARINGFAIKFVTPSQRHPGRRVVGTVRRIVTTFWQNDVQLGVVVHDGARGNLLVACQERICRVAEHHSELLIRLQRFIHHNGHGDLFF